MKNVFSHFANARVPVLFAIFVGAFTVVPSVAADEGYVIIVNKDNPVSPVDIKISHIRNVFMLNKTSWKGGKRATPIFPSKDNPSYTYLLKNVLKVSDNKLNHHWLQMKQKSGTSMPASSTSETRMIRYVADSAGGVAIVSADHALPGNVKAIVNLRF